MFTVEANHLAKSFGDVAAVVDVSFAVAKGEIFGLLGPNGAGKTTSIRILLDIFRPDSGTVSILGGPMTEDKKDRIGYLPEERGLYQEMKLEECLIYLATLKGMTAAEAHRRLQGYLERLDLAEHRTKKVKELSRGMTQKAQIINTVLPHPELLLVDEPFSGLDPVNTQLVKDMLLELRAGGSTIIMSTHMMHKVEELCDRIVLIDDGRNVLYGNLNDIRHDYAGNAVLLKVHGDLPPLSGVQAAVPHNGSTQLVLGSGMTPQDVLSQLVGSGVQVEQFEIAAPTLDEIFIKVVQARDKGSE